MKDRMPWKRLLPWIVAIGFVVLVVVLLMVEYSGLAVYLSLIGYFGWRVGERLFNDKEFVLRDVPRSVLRKAVAARSRILGGHGREKEPQQLNDIAVSVTYLKRVKYRYDRLWVLLLVTAGVFYALVYVFDLAAIDNLLMAPAVLILLLLYKEAILEFRIENGLFGSNAYEARTMIDFLLENAVKIDFTDGSGKPKRALLPEKLSEQASSVIPAQEAKA